jgi:hypothetical protein
MREKTMMRQPTTDTASSLTEATTRRGALRFLAAVAMAGAARAAFAAPHADAKKKHGKNKKGKKPGNGLCGRDRKLAALKVRYDGSLVLTPALEEGRSYRLRVSGVIEGTTALQTPVGVDAGYIFANKGAQLIARDSYAEVNIGLSVDGGAASWGDYAADHVYERAIQGQGQRLALRVVTKPESALSQGTEQVTAQRIISVDPELNLSGELTVEVLCA